MHKQTYQAELMGATARLRPGAHSYAGYSGPWIENVFFDAFQARLEELNQKLDMVYVPICFTDALLRGMSLEIGQALQGLNRTYRYFVVVQMDRGLGQDHPDYPVHIPHDLDVIGFMAGGCSVCRYFRRVVPIPLLKGEISPQTPPLDKKFNVLYQGASTHGLRAR
jgi:hypothetical protein